jgi:DNA-binding CsgD family transcriptional regulator
MNESQYHRFGNPSRVRITWDWYKPSIPYQGGLVHPSKIADILSCSAATVRYWIKKGCITGEDIIQSHTDSKNKSLMFFADGSNYSISEFAKQYDLSGETVHYHLNNGKKADDLLRRFSVKIRIRDELYTISKFSKLCGLTVSKVEKMVSRGLSHETIYSNYSNPIPRNR